MAGASVAAELAVDNNVMILEMERQPGYHSTGRSAATYIASYGNQCIRKLNRASESFLQNPPNEICEHTLLSPRGFLHLAKPGAEALMQEVLDDAPSIQEITPDQAIKRVPVLHREAIGRVALETEAMDIDVNALHSGYLRCFKARGGRLVCEARVERLWREHSLWQIQTTAGRFSAPVVVNAAGAWADQLAQSAGIPPIGLTPMRRTVAIIPAPAGHHVADWPLVYDVQDNYYFKPEAGKLLLSPSDETPVEPHDAYAEDLDIAIAVDALEQAVNFKVSRIEHNWAGLRTFAPDRSTVVGFEPTRQGFFWLAGQGGYGIQTAPAMARLAASLIRASDLPNELKAQDFKLEEVDPARFRVNT